MSSITVPNLIQMKNSGQKIIALTAYDYTTAVYLDRSGVDVLLVGDSLGVVFQGNETTLPVTLDEMIYHTKAVVRGAKRALVVCDLPFMSYQESAEQALRTAGRVLKESGAQAVKLEGGVVVAESIARIVSAGIPVMGHLGLTPQSYHTMGGHRVQGQSEEEASRILSDALALESAGVFAIVLEGIPAELAAAVTERVGVPTIGIGAGNTCSGQVLVVNDLFGLSLFADKAPKFVKQYANGGEQLIAAVQQFRSEVETGLYPDAAHSYKAKYSVA